MTHSVGFYYAVLLWAAILYGAGVAFKFGSLFLYEAFMPWVSDEPVKPRTKTHPPRPTAFLWWWLGGYLILSGLAQIPPVIALMTPKGLETLPIVTAQGGLGSLLTQAWVHGFSLHPIIYNILIFMVEAVLGLFLLTERGTPLGRVTAAASTIFGLFIWIFPEGFGFLFSCRNSWWAGAPGAGLLLAILSFLLVLPEDGWKTRYLRPLRILWIILWASGIVLQLTFFSRTRLSCLVPVGPHLPLPGFILATLAAFRHLVEIHPLTLNIALVILTALAGFIGYRSRVKLSLFGAIAMFGALWWFGEALGSTAQFALILNSAPLWFAYWSTLRLADQ